MVGLAACLSLIYAQAAALLVNSNADFNNNAVITAMHLDGGMGSWSIHDFAKVSSPWNNAGDPKGIGSDSSRLYVPIQKDSTVSWHTVGSDASVKDAGSSDVGSWTLSGDLSVLYTSELGSGPALVAVLFKANGECVNAVNVGTFPVQDGQVGDFHSVAEFEIDLVHNSHPPSARLSSASLDADGQTLRLLVKNVLWTFVGAMWTVNLASGHVERTPWMKPMYDIGQIQDHGNQLRVVKMGGIADNTANQVLNLDKSDIEGSVNNPLVECTLKDQKTFTPAIMLDSRKYLWRNGMFYGEGYDLNGFTVFMTIDVGASQNGVCQALVDYGNKHVDTDSMSAGTFAWLDDASTSSTNGTILV